jgi:ABC-type transport system involved in multi-copper enzyme maturation permease subunit
VTVAGPSRVRESGPVVRFGRLVRSEWRRIVRRPEMWIVLGLMTAYAALTYWQMYSSSIGSGGWDANAPRSCLEVMAKLREPFSFPSSLLSALDSASLAPLAISGLALLALASDFESGVVRTWLLATSSRGRLLASRITVVIGTAMVLYAAVFATAIVLQLTASLLGEHFSGSGLPLGAFAARLAVQFEAILGFALLAMLFATYARTVTMTLLAGIGYLGLEMLWPSLPWPGTLSWLREITLYQSYSSLFDQLQGREPTPYCDPVSNQIGWFYRSEPHAHAIPVPVAELVLVAWTLFLAFLLLRRFRRMDVMS